MSEGNSVLSLGGLLRRVGNFEPQTFIHNFDQRLVVQKTIYLMQTFGLYLGYPFHWYVRGPYSPQLAREAFALCKIYEKAQPVRFGSLESEKKFAQFMEFLGDKRNDADWLERLASIHFLRHVYPSRPKEDIISQVMRKQKYFSREKCEEAWNYLEKCALL